MTTHQTAEQTKTMPTSDIAEVLREAKIVDLTLTLDEDYPCIGDWLPPFRHVVYNWYVPLPDNPMPLRSRSYIQPQPDGTVTKGTYYSCWLTLHEHTGTHFDAPTHMIPPADTGLPLASEVGIFGDKVPLHQLQGPAAVLDVRSFREGPQEPGVSPIVKVDFVKAWEQEHGEIQPGDVVLFYTGWDEFYVPYPEGNKYLVEPLRTRTSPGWPAPDAEVVEYLADERGVRFFGIDTPTMGPAQDINTVHEASLGRGMTMVECLTNLGELPPRGSYFVFLPLKIARSSGSSGRAFAYVPAGL